MQQGRGGMGSHKHGISGHPYVAHRVKMWLRCWASDEERRGKRRRSTMYKTVKEAFAAALRGRDRSAL